MQVSRPAPTPKFASNFRFVTGDEFEEHLYENGKEEMMAQGEYAHYPWHIDSRVQLKKQGFTDSVYDCSAGGIYNGDRLTLFHLHPGRTLSKDAQVSQEALQSDISELADKKPVQGFITGGCAYKNGKEAASKQLYRMLTQLMEESGVQRITRIWGRKSKQDDGPLEVFYAPEQDTWYIHAESRGRPVLSRSDIERTFEVIEFAKGDTLQVSS